MNSASGFLEQVSFFLDWFAVLESDGFRVYSFDLLIVEEEVNFEVIGRFLCRNLAFNSEVADVIEFHLLFVIPQDERFRQERRRSVVNGCSFDDLGVVGRVF